MAIRAVAFDVFGTLVDWRTTVAEAFLASGVQGEPEELAVDWRNRLWPVLGEVNEGRRPWANFDELHLGTLGELLSERELDLAEDGRRKLVQAWHRLEPWPDVRDGLGELRRRRPVIALSNGHVALLVELARHGDLRFDCLVSAELARVYKPDPEIYLTGARLLGVEPAELMLAASHPLDLAAARRAGLRSGFIDRPLEYGPDSPPREDPDADLSVSDLHELAAALG
jgi:2-haloacid dehalogenase